MESGCAGVGQVGRGGEPSRRREQHVQKLGHRGSTVRGPGRQEQGQLRGSGRREQRWGRSWTHGPGGHRDDGRLILGAVGGLG